MLLPAVAMLAVMWEIWILAAPPLWGNGLNVLGESIQLTDLLSAPVRGGLHH